MTAIIIGTNIDNAIINKIIINYRSTSIVTFKCSSGLLQANVYGSGKGTNKFSKECTSK